jgi:hypothetical protein
VIAAEALSINAEGHEASAADSVDAAWKEEVTRAVAVLRTLREPTPEMVEAGRAAGDDPAAIWHAMVRAAIGQEETV